MLFSEKLTALRKEKGWSQEDLAEQLDVSRQSVSKWESSASLPDIDHIIQISDLFGVTTDYLLRDYSTERDLAELQTKPVPPPRTVTESEANSYLSLVEEEAPRFARAVMLCIFSIIPLLTLMALHEYNPFLDEDHLAGAGIIAMLFLVALAVRLFITGSMRLSPYSYLEKEPFSLADSLQAVIKSRLSAHQNNYTAGIVRGVTLCILSLMPMLLCACFGLPDWSVALAVCLMFLLVAIAVYGFVRHGMVHSSYRKLLQTEEYSPESKSRAPITEVFWCIATAVYLAVSFFTMDWQRTWII